MKTKPRTNGYYLCSVYYDTGGYANTPVKVVNGKIYSYIGTELRLSACKILRKLSVEMYVAYFRKEATKELRDLRKFKAARMNQINP